MAEAMNRINADAGFRIETNVPGDLCVLGLSLLLMVSVCNVAWAEIGDHDDHKHHMAPEQGAKTSTYLDDVQIPDVELVNQHGQKVRFYSDLVKDHVVGLSFIYTSCTTICSPIGVNVARLEKVLEQQSPKNDVQIISISIDPVVDTPERLKAWSEKFAPGPRWTLLTGSKTEVDHLLKTLKVFSASIEDHSPFFLIGDDSSGRWTLVNGLAAPTELANMLIGIATGADPAVTAVGNGDDDS